MSNKTDWKIPKLEIKEGEWYVCTNDWSMFGAKTGDSEKIE